MSVNSNALFVVHYWLDDKYRTHGKCTTDHRLDPGDVMYTQYGRATVRSCFHVTEVAPRAATTKGPK